MTDLIIARTVDDLRHALYPRRPHHKVALVPTMGALHDGHLSLVRHAAENATQIVVSLFVNPAQFAPHEDFEAYPRTEAMDVAKLRDSAADIIYAPTVAEMYPPGDATKVTVGGPSEGLETEFRPHFFSGVATVVSKLFIQCAPDVALFGEKDYQQLLVIRRMVRDLALPIDIIGAPIVREADGLALSSRNVYLNAEERQAAPVLFEALTRAARAARSGTPIASAEAAGRQAVLKAGFASVDYFTIRDTETLKPLLTLSGPARALVAARLGTTRLIDNIAV